MSYKENLKFNLENLIKKHNVTNEVLAEKTGISRSSINRIRMNKGNPTVETLISICDFFGVTVQELTGDEPLSQQISFENSDVNTIRMDSNRVPLIKWDSLESILLPNSSKQTNRPNTKFTGSLFASVTPKEYKNIPKESLLIFDKITKPNHGDYVLVINTQTSIINIAEYVQDISNAYIKSCLPEISNQHDLPLILLDNYNIFGVVLESRKMFRLI